jgi:hypothetical protein
MQEIDSMNVSVAAAILFEAKRQQAFRSWLLIKNVDLAFFHWFLSWATVEEIHLKKLKFQN